MQQGLKNKIFFFVFLYGQFFSQYAFKAEKTVSQYILRIWQEDQGLPQNTIMTLLQSRAGYIWLGTHEGLVRFDGLQFQVFDKKSTGGILINKIYGLYEEADGTLWAATYGGGAVFLKEGRFQALTTQNGLKSDVVWTVCGGQQGQIWLGTENGLARVSGQKVTNFTVSDGLPDNAIRALYLDKKRILWVGTVAGLCSWDESGFSQPITELAKEGIAAIFGDSQGRIWFGSMARGLYCLSKGKLLQYGQRQGLPPYITAICEDNSGGIWVGTRTNGVLLFDRDEWHSYTKQNGLSDEWIKSLLSDREGGIWIGTTEGGVDRIAQGKFQLFGVQEGLLENNVLSVVEDAHGVLWIGTANGLSMVDNGQVRNFTLASGLSSNAILALYQDEDGSLLVGTDRGLNRLQQGKFARILESRLSKYDVNAIFRDRDHTLWIGTSAGLFGWRKGKIGLYSTANGLSNNSVRTICQDRQGSLWIGTYGGGLTRFRYGRFEAFNSAAGLSNNVVVALYEDREGAIWIATGGGGLNRLQNGTISAVTIRNGLFDDTVHCVLEDDQGYLWMSCNKGIFHAKKKEINEVLAGSRKNPQHHPL